MVIDKKLTWEEAEAVFSTFTKTDDQLGTQIQDFVDLEKKRHRFLQDIAIIEKEKIDHRLPMQEE